MSEKDKEKKVNDQIIYKGCMRKEVQTFDVEGKIEI